MWHRAGIVAAMAWELTVGGYWLVRLSTCHADKWGCDFLASSASGWDASFWATASALQLWRIGMAGNAFFAAVIFPVAAYAIIWIAAASLRWVLAGRPISN